MPLGCPPPPPRAWRGVHGRRPHSGAVWSEGELVEEPRMISFVLQSIK